MDSIVLIVVVIVVVLVLIFSYSKQQSAYVPMIYLCTKTEANLFRQLNKKLPEHYHLASKVRLADVCLPRNRKDIGMFNRVAQKHLDFVIVDAQSSKIICAIELDDASHFSRSVQKRDQVKNAALKSAGVTLFRVKPKRNYKEFIGSIVASLDSTNATQKSVGNVTITKEKPLQQNPSSSNCPSCNNTILDKIEMGFINKGKSFYQCNSCKYRTEPV